MNSPADTSESPSNRHDENVDRTSFDLTVSVVSYNTRELLRTCLNALGENSDGLKLQIIVADNGSHDGSPAMVREEFPHVELLSTGGNIGYGPANNLAFQQARGRYFCTLNSDAFVQPGTLRTLCEWMEAHHAAGACVPMLVWPDGAEQPAHGPDPKLGGIFWEQTMLGGVRSRLAAMWPRAAYAGGPESEASREVDGAQETEQLNGACLFCRHEAYAQVGGYDPSYWMYVEDVDLSVRLRGAGWKLYYLPQARVVHHLGASSHDASARAKMIASYNRSRVVYFGRLHGRAAARYVKALTIFGAALRLAGWTMLALARPKARDKVRLFRETLRRTWQI